jgi:hypothetical protein
MQDLRDALYTHLQRMPLRFFTQTKAGRFSPVLPMTSAACSGWSPRPRHRSWRKA